MMSARVVGIIPARFASSRLPGKLLLHLKEKSIIQRVYEQCLKSKMLDKVLITTDDERILNHAQNFGAHVHLSHSSHQSGTDRIAEAAATLTDFTHVINIQGDEPFINPEHIDRLIQTLQTTDCEIATLGQKLIENEFFNNPNSVKVVADNQDFALYFSRSGIPFLREPGDVNHFSWIKHIGLYGFRREVLIDISQISPSNLELIERLEQLRWLQNGYQIKMAFVDQHLPGIDTIEDFEAALQYANLHNL